MIAPIDTLNTIVVTGFDETQDSIKKHTNESSNLQLNIEDVKQKASDIRQNVEENKKNGETSKTNKVDYNNLTKKLEEMLQSDELTIVFSVDKETKKMVMKLINPETKEIVQQFPPEITLKIARIVAATLDNGQVANAKI
jgi:uncharacterized FlaG/YvyC family protein